jgi:hypothetical protein
VSTVFPALVSVPVINSEFKVVPSPGFCSRPVCNYLKPHSDFLGEKARTGAQRLLHHHCLWEVSPAQAFVAAGNGDALRLLVPAGDRGIPALTPEVGDTGDDPRLPVPVGDRGIPVPDPGVDDTGDAPRLPVPAGDRGIPVPDPGVDDTGDAPRLLAPVLGKITPAQDFGTGGNEDALRILGHGSVDSLDEIDSKSRGKNWYRYHRF